LIAPGGIGVVRIDKLDQISERLIGWGCLGATVTEYVNPNLLAMDISHAAGLGAFGFLLATGRASAIVGAVRRMFTHE
jgi:hypothetical protein